MATLSASSPPLDLTAPSVHRSRPPSRGPPSTPRHLHSRGATGSRGGSANSIDYYEPVLTSASAFDYYSATGIQSSPRARNYPYPPALVSTDQKCPSELAHSFFDDLDVAPAPTVPAGRRRSVSSQRPAVTTPSSPHPHLPLLPLPPSLLPLLSSSLDVHSSHEPSPPAVDRDRSIRSSKASILSRYRRHHSHVSHQPRFGSNSPDLDSAPAPYIGYEKSKQLPALPLPLAASLTASQITTKDRPGFFRRVFGSAKHNSHADRQASPVASDYSVALPDSCPASGTFRNQHQHQTQTYTPPRSADESSSPSPNVLQKRPSFFFRRKKSKSVTGHNVPPFIPPPLPTLPNLVRYSSGAVPPALPGMACPDTSHDQSPPSPVSSLSKAMKPFLKDRHSLTTSLFGADRFASHPSATQNDRYQHRYSPEYEPNLNANVRTVTLTGPPPTASVARPFDHMNSSSSFLDLSSTSINDDPLNLAGCSPCCADESPWQGNVYEALGIDNGGADETIRARVSRVAMPRLEVMPDGDKQLSRPMMSLPAEPNRSISPISASTGSEYNTAPSGPPSATPEAAFIGNTKPIPHPACLHYPTITETDVAHVSLTNDDRLKALKIYDGAEVFVTADRAAAWLGEMGPARHRTLLAYLELFDFAHLAILGALRQLCARLILRAETQQVDRILAAFAERWCFCNPEHGFKSVDIVHTMAYSIILLNTDLHLANIDQRMTRGQFVKNTLTTIRHALHDSDPAAAFDRPSILPGRSRLLFPSSLEADADCTSSGRRGSFRPFPGSDPLGAVLTDYATDECGPLVRIPFEGNLRAWESQVEAVLKSIYASIRDVRLPLHKAESPLTVAVASQSSLSIIGVLKRTPSVLSKAPSESPSFRGRISEVPRGVGLSSRWKSKSRSRPRFGGGLGGSGAAGMSSSRTSFDEGNSIWSPANSSAAFSRYSLGRTHTSISVDSFGSTWPRGLQPIGFTNALNQAITSNVYPAGVTAAASAASEKSTDLVLNDERTGIPKALLEDESLELAGPPWVKEGKVVHKHHLEGVDKKAKERSWVEAFAVVQKGTLSLFSFAPNKSLRQRSRSTRFNVTPLSVPGLPASSEPVVVGGGNWQDSATQLGSFSLQQTLASALPPPGYSRTRPHVWALSLPTGGVHLFHVGTPEIAQEFVSTANYWSARLSTHPLVGGISNVEYGWSDAIVNNALVLAINEGAVGPPPLIRPSRPGSSMARPSTNTGASSTQSMGGSSSFDIPGTGTGTGSGSGSGSRSRSGSVAGSFALGGIKFAGDRIHISEWAPPTQSLRASVFPQARQLETLQAYVAGIETDLQSHNRLRAPLQLAFSPRGTNAGRAMANWERRSAYLLREIVKFRTYVDALLQSEVRQAEVYAERNAAVALDAVS